MTSFPVHTLDSAPERSKPVLQQLQPAFGMIPNIAGAMATSPGLQRLPTPTPGTPRHKNGTPNLNSTH
jgi:hypothetical protein